MLLQGMTKLGMRLFSFGFGCGNTRAVRCYITLILWIVLASIAFYWFLTQYASSVDNSNYIWTFEQYRVDQEKASKDQKYVAYNALHPRRKDDKKFYQNLKAPRSRGDAQADLPFLETEEYEDFPEEDDPVLTSINRLCNHPDDIKFGDEYVRTPEFVLDAVAIVFRHGDRGPLSHVGSHNLSNIDCSVNDPEYSKFQQYMTDTVMKVPGYQQFIGPFQSFQKVPSTSNCQLGQLSQLGALQLLRLGKALKSTYAPAFRTSSNRPTAVKAATTSLTTVIPSVIKELHPLLYVKAVAYSTRYRRTLQSLMAFLYGLFGPKLMVSNVNVKESQSITFCFNDCSCRATDKLKKGAGKSFKPKRGDKQQMISLLDQINSIISSPKSKKTGTTLLDLLLVYPCHNVDLPCKESQNSISSAVQFKNCVTKDHVLNLIDLLQKENHYQKKITSYKQYHVLTSYGLMKEIVNLSLKMTSTIDKKAASKKKGSVRNNVLKTSARTRIGIFSGHDTTLQSLLGSLGIYSGHPDIHLVPYASRLIFEFYRKTNVAPDSPRKHYFRVVFNGKSVTHLLKFCQQSARIIYANSSLIAKAGLGANIDNTFDNNDSNLLLCPLENLVRFVHDRYFEVFGNVTNFKEACEKSA